MEEVEMRNLRDSKGNTRSRHHKKVTAHLHPKGRTLRGRAPQVKRVQPHSTRYDLPYVPRNRSEIPNIDRYVMSKKKEIPGFVEGYHYLGVNKADGAIGHAGLTKDYKRRSLSRPYPGVENLNQRKASIHAFSKPAGKYGPTGGTPTPSGFIVGPTPPFVKPQRRQNQVRLAKAGRTVPPTMAPTMEWMRTEVGWKKNPAYTPHHKQTPKIINPQRYNEMKRQGYTDKQLLEIAKSGKYEGMTGMGYEQYWISEYAWRRAGPKQPSIRDVEFAARDAGTYMSGILQRTRADLFPDIIKLP